MPVTLTRVINIPVNARYVTAGLQFVPFLGERVTTAHNSKTISKQRMYRYSNICVVRTTIVNVLQLHTFCDIVDGRWL